MIVRELRPQDAARCDEIIASLPEWFGLDEGIREASDAVRHQHGLVYERDGTVLGFVTYEPRATESAEITWIAVHANVRGGGIGTALLEVLTARLIRGGKRLLFVKTVSDRKDPGPEYAATRAFYLARGFVPAAELDLDPPDPENPIQLMVLALSAV
jgi:N-acetylglutamate synthase-like GNAT family acetyltransferase